MKKRIGILIGLLALNYTLAQSIDRVAVTVYNNNLGVVKENRTIPLEKGQSSIAITDVARLIDPTSVHIKLDANVLEQNYQYDLVGMDKILQKYIDKDIRLINGKGELIEGKLLSAQAGQIVIEKTGGGLIMLPNLSEYRISVESLPEGLITKPTLVWLVNSSVKGNQKAEVSYQTSGMSWHAEYVAVLNEDDSKLDLNSWVSIENNSGATYNNAGIKLMAGDVNLVRQRQPEYALYSKRAEMAAESQFEEKEFFEYHIYNLTRPSTLVNNETKQISLFEADGIKATKKYTYSGRYGRSSKGKVAVTVEFENSEKNSLGVPFPKGKIRVYKADEKTVEFIGEDLIDHTPKNELIKLKIGDAFDIIAEETETKREKISDRVHEVTTEIKIKNHKSEKVKVEVEKYFGNSWKIKNSSIEPYKKNSTTAYFDIPVEANGETILEFTVRYTY